MTTADQHVDGSRDDLPAWSAARDGEVSPEAPSLGDGVTITRDWAFGDRSGRGVRVAVVDSGIDASHPLVGRVDEFVAVVLDDDAPDGVRFESDEHDDLFGHGTACAALIRSIAPEVELVSVRVLGSNLKGSARAFAHGLDWCIRNRVRVANLSLSTVNERYAEKFHGLVDSAAFARMLVVSAMSNERKRSIPSEYSGVFSVACGPGDDRERFSCNPDAPAEWWAPGVDVEVAWLAQETISATGNSFAAPVIAGHLARIIATHPLLTTWQARTVLAALADNAPSRDR